MLTDMSPRAAAFEVELIELLKKYGFCLWAEDELIWIGSVTADQPTPIYGGLLDDTQGAAGSGVGDPSKK